MTRNEILQEITTLLGGLDLDITQFIITGKAANVLCNNTDDPTMDSIDIWVNKKYYDIIAEDDEYAEFNDEEVPYIAFGYITITPSGMVKLYRGKLPKPEYRKINGYNVQTSIRETDTARILNFPGKKEQDDTMD